MLDHILLFLAACIILIPFYLLIRRPWRFTGRYGRLREWLLGIFTIFMLGLLFMTFRGTYAAPRQMLESALERIETRQDISFVPLKNLRYMYLYWDRELFIMNLLGNTLMFIPWGFMRPLLWKKQQGLRRAIFGAIGLTVFIEFVQLFIGRSVDIDDIILNFAGSMAGSGLYALVSAIFPGIDEIAG